MLLAAFRDLHASRLHGFCLLVAMGDRSPAATAASRALTAAAARLEELRHPERAAAWLRGTALRALAAGGARPREAESARREHLRGLGVTDAVFSGLSGLSQRERAAFVASVIERLDTIDVEAVVGADATTTRRLVGGALVRYLSTAEAAVGDEPDAAQPADGAPPGELSARLQGLADRALGGAWSER